MLVPLLAKKSRIAVGPETGAAPGGIRLASAAYIASKASKFGSLIAASHRALSFAMSSVSGSARAADSDQQQHQHQRQGFAHDFALFDLIVPPVCAYATRAKTRLGAT